MRRWLRWLPPLALLATVLVWRSPWGVALGLCVAVGVHQILKRLGLDWQPHAPWQAHSHTPDAALFTGHAVDHDRLLDDTLHEIGMGGPEVGTVMLAGGMLLDAVARDTAVLAAHDAQGPCRAALCRGPAGGWITLADLATHTRYHLRASRLPPASVFEHWRGLGTAERAAAWRACMAAHAQEAEALVPLRGLWVSAAQASRAQTHGPTTLRLPSGRRLQARSLLPDDVRGARNPAQWIGPAPHQLWVDGQATPCHVRDLQDACESPDGRVLVVRGVQLGRWGHGEGALYHLADMASGQPPRWLALRALVHEGPQPCELSAPAPDDHRQVHFALQAPPARHAPRTVAVLASGFDQPVLRLKVRRNHVVVTLPPADSKP
ncbi:MAG: hypothetical protein Q4G71_08095 [Pseudomonadota bacterium]|nr:hypothetical protein [Pseudomonadota bacterium]